MRKLHNLLLALVAVITAAAQQPTGFNYQAVLRNSSGQVLANQIVMVKLSITSSDGSTTHYAESHSASTNQFGLINLVVGGGTVLSGSFAAVPWGTGQQSLKVEVSTDGGGTFSDLGSQKIQSVPMAVYADSTNLKFTKNLVVVGNEPSNPDDPIFEVKNSKGEVLFGVYQEGVRINIPDSAITKGAKGGFAVGGLTNQVKGNPTEYLRVTPDSTRVLVREIGAKGRKGGFAVGGLTNQVKNDSYHLLYLGRDSARIYIDTVNTQKGRKGGFAVGGLTNEVKGSPSRNYFDVAADTAGMVNPSQKRVLWYPLKNALLAGRVLIESKDSVGENSFASGYESKAVGQFSQALGYQSIARGDYSTAIGRNSLANGNFSYAFGYNAMAEGTGNYAFGSLELDTTGSPLPGTYTKAAGTYSIAFGLGANTSNGTGNLAIGVNAKSSGEKFSLAIGERAVSSGYRAISLGNTGFFESPPTLLLFSKPNTASGSGALAIGFGNTSSAAGSITIGTGNRAEESYSVAVGRVNAALGKYSVAMGYDLDVSSYMATAIGRWNYDFGSTSEWIGTDPIFLIGIGYQVGSSIIKKNALTVLKNGNTGIGTDTPIANLHLSTKPFASITSTTNNFIMEVANGLANWKKWNFMVNGGAGAAQNMNLRIINDDGTASSRDIMTWLNTGNVGIGTITPTYKLDVNGEITSRSYNSFRLRQALYSVIIRNDNENFYILLTNDNDPDGTWNTRRPFILKRTGDILLGNEGGNIGIGTYSPGYKLQVGNLGDGTQARANAWNLLSDARYKTNLMKVESALLKLESINGYFFNWNVGTDKSRQIGLLAQEVEKVLPEVVSKGEDGILSLDYGKLVPLLVESIKEQQQQIDTQQKENAELKSEVQSLREELEQIKALLAGGR